MEAVGERFRRKIPVIGCLCCDGRRGGGVGCIILARSVVRRVGQAGLESSELGVWAGLDHFVRHDRGSRMAALAASSRAQVAGGIGAFCAAAGGKRLMVLAFFWFEVSRVGVARHHRDVAIDRSHCRHVFSGASGRWLATDSLLGLGQFCRRSESGDLAIELRTTIEGKR